MKLSQCIAADRKAQGLSQGDLAKRLGVTQQSVAKWERGSTPRGKRLASLVKVLGTTSQTAAAVSATVSSLPHNESDNMGQQGTHPTQTQALAALASAARDIAMAAKAIADSVAAMTSKTPPGPGKH
jgi:transcriptional regulator with XRE-family HTH domain